MEWTEVIIRVPVSDVDRAGDIAQMVVPTASTSSYSHLEEEAGKSPVDLLTRRCCEGPQRRPRHVYISPEENPQEAVAYLSERSRRGRNQE